MKLKRFEDILFEKVDFSDYREDLDKIREEKVKVHMKHIKKQMEELADFLGQKGLKFKEEDKNFIFYDEDLRFGIIMYSDYENLYLKTSPYNDFKYEPVYFINGNFVTRSYLYWNLKGKDNELVDKSLKRIISFTKRYKNTGTSISKNNVLKSILEMKSYIEPDIIENIEVELTSKKFGI